MAHGSRIPREHYDLHHVATTGVASPQTLKTRNSIPLAIEVSAGTNVALRFSTVSNQLYIVESRDALATGSWATVTNNVPSTGSIIAVTNRVSPTLSGRFYRVRQLP